MRKLIIAASAAGLLAASTVAGFAAEASGAITAIDPASQTVTLADGQVFKLPVEFDAASVQVGQDVTITYEQGADGSMEASAVTPNS